MPKSITTDVVDQETGEVLEVDTNTALATRRDYGGVMIGGQKFEVVGLVNVPTLKHESGATVAFEILMRIVAGTNDVERPVVIDGVKTVVTEQVPINVVRVRSLNDGLEYEYVLNAIAADCLINGYPENGYVGKFFAIRKGDVVPGKRYKEVEVIEIKLAA